MPSSSTRRCAATCRARGRPTVAAQVREPRKTCASVIFVSKMTEKCGILFGCIFAPGAYVYSCPARSPVGKEDHVAQASSKQAQERNNAAVASIEAEDILEEDALDDEPDVVDAGDGLDDDKLESPCPMTATTKTCSKAFLKRSLRRRSRFSCPRWRARARCAPCASAMPTPA